MKPLACRSDVRASADASFDGSHANQAADGRLQDLSLDPGAHALEARGEAFRGLVEGLPGEREEALP